MEEFVELERLGSLKRGGQQRPEHMAFEHEEDNETAVQVEELVSLRLVHRKAL